ncbi:MAG: hypothetical protein JNL43_07045 [Flavobacteriales bacterium]|nr:hypothetical protein [Flavobacteriales bacterium]
MDLKGLVADHMGHFSIYDIPSILFVLVAATLIGFVMAKWGAGVQGVEARKLAFWCTVAALATAIVRSQLPIAALVLAAAVLVGKRSSHQGDDALFWSILLAGIGCGSGATVIVCIAMVPYLLLMRWAYRPSAHK